MVPFSIILILFVVFKNYLAGGALVAESLISENEADEGKFTYQAIIMGKPNGSEVSALQGSAGIISPKHLLGGAQVFIDEDGNHRKLTFSAVVDEINAKREDLILIAIVRFFLPGSGGYKENDIAVSELLEELDLDYNPRLSELHIPDQPLEWNPPLATVAGYGFNWIETKIGGGIKNGTTDGKLRYASVKIATSSHCVPYKLSGVTYLCGIMIVENRNRGRPRGLCVHDYGSPLVITKSYRNIVVGIASSNNNNCNDEALGGLYTSVSENFWFIYGVLRSEPAYKTLVYENRPHTMDNKLTEEGNSSEM